MLSAHAWNKAIYIFFFWREMNSMLKFLMPHWPAHIAFPICLLSYLLFAYFEHMCVRAYCQQWNRIQRKNSCNIVFSIFASICRMQIYAYSMRFSLWGSIFGILFRRVNLCGTALPDGFPTRCVSRCLDRRSQWGSRTMRSRSFAVCGGSVWVFQRIRSDAESQWLS